MKQISSFQTSLSFDFAVNFLRGDLLRLFAKSHSALKIAPYDRSDDSLIQGVRVLTTDSERGSRHVPKNFANSGGIAVLKS